MLQLSGTIRSTVLGFFQLFFDDELIQEIVSSTNTYCGWKLAGSALPPQSKWSDWVDLTSQEFKAYLGVIFNMAPNDKHLFLLIFHLIGWMI